MLTAWQPRPRDMPTQGPLHITEYAVLDLRKGTGIPLKYFSLLFCQLFKNYLVLGKDTGAHSQWHRSDYRLSPAWLSWGDWLEVECSCSLWAVVRWCVWAFWLRGGLGAEIKQLCALWTWATSASWQAVMQPHAEMYTCSTCCLWTHCRICKCDTQPSLLTRGVLSGLYRSHTQAHPPPDWLQQCLRTRWVVIRGRGRLMLPSSPPTLNCPGLTARLMPVTWFPVCLGEKYSGRPGSDADPARSWCNEGVNF